MGRFLLETPFFVPKTAQNERKSNFFEENMKKVGEKFGGTENS